MRIIQGTPGEIAELHKLTGILDPDNSGSPLPQQGSDDEQDKGAILASTESTLSQAVQRWIAERAGGSSERRALVEDFASRVVGLGEVQVERGTSVRTADGTSRYLMLRNSGPRNLGAAMYLHPSNGRVTFHLDADRAKGRRFAQPSERLSPYRVRIYLTSPEAVEEAVELAKEALENTK